VLDGRAQFPQAGPLYQRAVTIMEKTLGAEHPLTKVVRANYNELLEDMKRHEK